MKPAAALLAMLFFSTTVWSDDESRYEAVSGLGALNGIALQCKYLDQVRRMKAAVVAYAPKERSFGLAFDQATNEAFLAFARRGEVCPAHVSFEQQVGQQVDRMAQMFVKQQSGQ